MCEVFQPFIVLTPLSSASSYFVAIWVRKFNLQMHGDLGRSGDPKGLEQPCYFRSERLYEAESSNPKAQSTWELAEHFLFLEDNWASGSFIVWR